MFKHALTIGSLMFALPAYAQSSESNIVGDVVGGVVETITTTITAGQKLADAEQVTPQTDSHGSALYEGYLGLSRVEYNEGDYKDSDVFAGRAIAAAEGSRFEPEAIMARELPVDELNYAANQRRRLVVAQSLGARDIVPIESAEAQIAFDCWMQEQEEDFQFDDIAACRERFDLAMAAIEKAMVPQEPPEPERVVLEVFFDFDSSVLSTEAMANIEAFANIVGRFRTPVVSVIGNADQTGEENYNFELSQKRAAAVATELEARGVVPDGIFARGDQAPAVDRVDRAPERVNRRVIMVVRAG